MDIHNLFKNTQTVSQYLSRVPEEIAYVDPDSKDTPRVLEPNAVGKFFDVSECGQFFEYQINDAEPRSGHNKEHFTEAFGIIEPSNRVYGKRFEDAVNKQIAGDFGASISSVNNINELLSFEQLIDKIEWADYTGVSDSVTTDTTGGKPTGSIFDDGDIVTDGGSNGFSYGELDVPSEIQYETEDGVETVETDASVHNITESNIRSNAYKTADIVFRNAVRRVAGLPSVDFGNGDVTSVQENVFLGGQQLLGVIESWVVGGEADFVCMWNADEYSTQSNELVPWDTSNKSERKVVCGGDIDNALDENAETPMIDIRVLDGKATREDRSGYHIQTTMYAMLIDNRLREIGFGEYIGWRISAGVITRDDPIQQNATPQSLPAYDIETVTDDVSAILSDDGRLAELAMTAEQPNYTINSKCNSCIYREACVTSAVREESLALLGVDESLQEDYAKVGVETLTDLAQLTKPTINERGDIELPDDDFQREIATQRLQELSTSGVDAENVYSNIKNAQSILQNIKPESEFGLQNHYPNSYKRERTDYIPLPEHGNSYGDGEDSDIPFVKVYLNVAFDDVYDRTSMISARVELSDKQTGEVIVENVTEMVESIPNYSDLEDEIQKIETIHNNVYHYEQAVYTRLEAELLHRFSIKVQNAISDAIRRSEYETTNELFTHFYIYNNIQYTDLKDAYKKHANETPESVDIHSPSPGGGELETDDSNRVGNAIQELKQFVEDGILKEESLPEIAQSELTKQERNEIEIFHTVLDYRYDCRIRNYNSLNDNQSGIQSVEDEIGSNDQPMVSVLYEDIIKKYFYKTSTSQSIIDSHEQFVGGRFTYEYDVGGNEYEVTDVFRTYIFNTKRQFIDNNIYQNSIGELNIETDDYNSDILQSMSVGFVDNIPPTPTDNGFYTGVRETQSEINHLSGSTLNPRSKYTTSPTQETLDDTTVTEADMKMLSETDVRASDHPYVTWYPSRGFGDSSINTEYIWTALDRIQISDISEESEWPVQTEVVTNGMSTEPFVFRFDKTSKLSVMNLRSNDFDYNNINAEDFGGKITKRDVSACGEALTKMLSDIENNIATKCDSSYWVSKTPINIDELGFDIKKANEDVSVAQSGIDTVTIENQTSINERKQRFQMKPWQRILDGKSIIVDIEEIEESGYNEYIAYANVPYDEINQLSNRDDTGSLKSICRLKNGSYMKALPIENGDEMINYKRSAKSNLPHESRMTHILNRGGKVILQSYEPMTPGYDVILRLTFSNEFRNERQFRDYLFNWDHVGNVEPESLQLKSGGDDGEILETGTRFVLDELRSGYINQRCFDSLQIGRYNKTTDKIEAIINNEFITNEPIFDTNNIKKFTNKTANVIEEPPTQEQRIAVEDCENTFVSVQGPPGTGKTSGTFATALLARAYDTQQRHKDGIFAGTATSNTAVDEMMDAFCERKNEIQNKSTNDQITNSLKNIIPIRLTSSIPEPSDIPDSEREGVVDGAIYYNKQNGNEPYITDSASNPGNGVKNKLQDIFTNRLNGFEQRSINGIQLFIFATPSKLYGDVKTETEVEDCEDIDELLITKNNGIFDAIALDEASMMKMYNFTLAGTFATSDCQYLIGGDHRQMSPVHKTEWDTIKRHTTQTIPMYASVIDFFRSFTSNENIPYIDTEFSRVIGDEKISENIDNISNFSGLSKSFRCHQSVTELLKKSVYEQDNIDYHSNKTKTLNDIGAETYEHPNEITEKIIGAKYPITLIVTNDTQSVHTNITERNIAGTIYEYTEKLQEKTNTDITHGVVTPHNAQRGNIETYINSTFNTQPQIDTVERFQGGEKDSILVCTTVSDQQALLDEDEFILDPNRLTVAISRMKKKVYIVVSENMLTMIPQDPEIYERAYIWKSMYKYAKKECSEMYTIDSNTIADTENSQMDVELDIYHID